MPSKNRRIGGVEETATSPCQLTSPLVVPSDHAVEVGYVRATGPQRARAQGTTRTETWKEQPYTFPAPLILPEDDLAVDPKHPAQSLLSWIRLKDRNHVTPGRRTVYIAEPPLFHADVSFGGSWATPRCLSNTSASTNSHPRIADVADYIRAFYHPLPVKFMSKSFKFVSWSPADLAELKKKKSSMGSNGTSMIGLQTADEIIGVRTRVPSSSDFLLQLNLDDLLDAAIASLPADAYALLMLVNQDLYEDDDDEFVCGRAYGGSRVAVVSTARYNPALDTELKLDLDHVWPLSHCAAFVNGFTSKKRKLLHDHDMDLEGSTASPLGSAIHAAKDFRRSTVEKATALWLGRVCRTASHELGHCFGIGHCIYYACCMQGSASLKEDSRQPPYLCPIDQTKVLKATGASEENHLKAMLDFCRQHGDVELFVAYAAWLRRRLEDTGSAIQPPAGSE